MSPSLEQAQASLAGADARQVLAWANEHLGERGVIASSFGVEDVVLIDLASEVAPKLRVLTLDTGRLNPETYEVMERIRERYHLTLETYAPEAASVEALVGQKGFFSFFESIEARKECCRIRKVEPLKRALAGRAGWVTGMRREQSPTREGVPLVELDSANGGLFKLNPLAAWTTEQVWAHVKAQRVPYHPLHDKGYPSIGCAPCTRAVKAGEGLRDGRWWWESADKKECGIHDRGNR